MIEVRISHAPEHMEKYVGLVGTVTGFSGQYVKVCFEGSANVHLFLPEELKQF